MLLSRSMALACIFSLEGLLALVAQDRLLLLQHMIYRKNEGDRAMKAAGAERLSEG